jgi:uncharacterized protein (DUF305 family)
MTARIWTIIAVVGVVALGAGVGIGAAAWAGGDHGSEGMAGATGPGHGGGAAMDDRGAEADTPLNEREFMAMMVPHHESAVRMARLALDRAQHPEVRRLAQRIIASQEAEIGRMHAWHEQWFGEELEVDMTGPHAMLDMPALEAAREDFDRRFLAMMVPHHASAVMMADRVRLAGPRGQIDLLAREIIAAQANEIGQMQRWREQWYPPIG